MRLNNMKLITFREFPAKHSAFSEGGLRSLRFNEKTNGFEGVFVNVGRRVYIDEDAFFKAVERLNQKPSK